MLSTPASRLASEPLQSVQRPNARPLDLETLYFTKVIRSCQWSADGRWIYFETNTTGRFNIWRAPADGGWPVQITVSDERTALAEPAPDGRWLLYTQDEGGNEKPNLFLLPSNGGPARNLTQTRGVGYRSIRWSPDGARLAFAAERAAPGEYAVYSLDVPSGAVERVAGTEHGQCSTLVWSPDGARLALTRTRDYINSGASILDLATGAERVLVPLGQLAAYELAGWTRDGAGLIVTSDDNPAHVAAVALLHVAAGALEWLTLGEWETAALDVARAADRFVYVQNVGGSHRVFVRDLSGAETQIPLPPGVVSQALFSPDGRRLLLLHAAGDSPTEIWRYDLDSGALRQISQSLVGGLSRDDFVRPQLVVYPSFDGTPIAAFVYLPPNSRPDRSRPAIVCPHGGPTWQHQNGWFPNLQYLVSHGFVVIAPNFRGSTGFGRIFQEANRRDLGGGDLRDVVAAAEYLERTDYVDPRRIAVMGGSYGGYLTLMALTRYPERWAAGVAIVPFANWFTEYEHEDPVLQAYDREMMGDPVADAALWRDRSPIFFVDRIRAPLLLLAGANDIRCPAEETEQIIAAIRAAGGVAEAKIYENEGHGFARRENQIDAFRRTAEFLRRHLQPAPPP